jgi:site-specific recombinase XerD
MLEQIDYRRKSSGMSVRALASELGVSHTLLSLTLNGKRKPSRSLLARMKKWSQTPLAVDPPNAPSTVYGRFIDEKRAQLAPLTVKFYEAKLAPFIVWCERQKIIDVLEVERHDVSAFLAHIRKGRRNKSLSNGALKLHHQTLKTLFAYVGDTCDSPQGWKNPLDGIKVKGSQTQTLEFSDEEIKCMVTAFDDTNDEILRSRNQAIILVLLSSAVRASEMLAMNVNDIGIDGRVKVTGKGSKQRVITVGEAGRRAVDEYLVARGNKTGAMWQTHDGNRLTTDGLRGLMSRVQRDYPDVFVDGLYAHRFRHTAITRLLRARVPLRSVQRYAGHSSPQTTLRYAQAIDADEAIAVAQTFTYK